MTSGRRGRRAYHRHIWKAYRGGWWAVFFFYGEKVSNFWRNFPFFFKKNLPKFPLIFGERVSSCVNLCGDRYLASVATVQKWPNRKKKTKKNEKEKDW